MFMRIMRIAATIFLCAPWAHAMSSAHDASLFDIEKTPNGFVLSFPEVPAESITELINRDDLASWKSLIQDDIVTLESDLWEKFDTWQPKLVELHKSPRTTKMQKAQYVQLCHSLHQQFVSLTKEHPLMLCSECGMARSSPSTCPLSRTTTKECPRKSFIDGIMQTFPAGPKDGIIFFGPGGCMFEIQLAAMYLNNGATFKKIFLIDPAYKLTPVDMQRFNRVIGGVLEDDSYDIEANRLRHIYRLVQVSYFLWSFDRSIKIYVYDNQGTYRADLAKDPRLAADALVAMDPIEISPEIYLLRPELAHAQSKQVQREIKILEGSLIDGSLVAVAYNEQGTTDVTIELHDRACANCGSHENLKTCARCASAHYCARECQIAHWKTVHKDECCAAK